MLVAVRTQGLEGVIGKRKDSVYEPGKRSGAWIKYRVNAGQGFVVGGYIPGGQGVDSVIVGFYRDSNLIYVARVRNGCVPATRRMVFEKLKPLVQLDCPFVNLPETHKGRWGEGLTADEMRKCVWVEPKLVAQIEFLEWTAATVCDIQSLPDCARIKTQRRSRRSLRKIEEPEEHGPIFRACMKRFEAG